MVRGCLPALLLGAPLAAEVVVTATAAVESSIIVTLGRDGSVAWATNDPDAAPPFVDIGGESVMLAEQARRYTQAALLVMAKEQREARLAVVP